MEFEIKIKNKKIKREEGPTRNQKMRYFKISFCRNFHWKVRDYLGFNDTCWWYLRSKNGVWQVI